MVKKIKYALIIYIVKKYIIQLSKIGITHGDLHRKNIMFKANDKKKLYFIDFGRSYPMTDQGDIAFSIAQCAYN